MAFEENIEKKCIQVGCIPTAALDVTNGVHEADFLM